MKVHHSDLGLSIDSPLVNSSAENFRPRNWPPSSDEVVVVDSNGEVVSRYGDSVWRLDPWANKAMCINFGDGPRGRGQEISPDNAALLRLIVAWWIWGPKGVRYPQTLRFRFSKIRNLFVICTKYKILASDLKRYPLVALRFIEEIAPSTAESLLTYLHEIYEARDALGFVLFDREGLAELTRSLPQWEAKQTPYIPPRIWRYQVARLRECIDDFLAHKEEFEACYRFCLDAYAKNYGSLEEAVRSKANKNKSPFCCKNSAVKNKIIYHGAFHATAERFGIDHLLSRWIASTSPSSKLTLNDFAKYTKLISTAGLAYILNFSLMRVSEGQALRFDCLKVEHDPQFGDIFMLEGPTTKTKREDDARWPTSPSVVVAVEAMKSIANLQLLSIKACQPEVQNVKGALNPCLIQRSTEPWSKPQADNVHLQLSRQTYDTQLISRYPKLFDRKELIIQDDDLKTARFVTPSLDPVRFALGKTWPFSYHQLRRTGAVNMQASGLVSDSSLQYLLKHATRAMSLYYGRNYSRLRLNDEARTIYVRTMYESIGQDFARILNPEVVSPHGERRKEELINILSVGDIKKLTAIAEKGELVGRRILLGYCMNKEPCPYGGVDSIANCGGGATGKPCPDVLYSKASLSKLKMLDLTLNERLATAKKGSPLHQSLLAQKRSLQDYKNVTKIKW